VNVSGVDDGVGNVESVCVVGAVTTVVVAFGDDPPDGAVDAAVDVAE
jgi:hypothetical protein